MTVSVTPVRRKRKITKKRTKFARYQSDQFMRVGASWRRPIGIDGRMRRRFKGTPAHVKIGYGTEKKMRHVLTSGFKKFTVHNEEEVDMLLMLNRVYAAEIGHSVSADNRRGIIRRCAELNIRCVNPASRLKTKEEEA